MAIPAQRSSLATNVSDETSITIFYNKLSSLAQHIHKYGVLTIGGGMNAQIGKEENNKFR